MELNKNEIIKALEWCSELRLCVDCPMRAEGYFSHSGNACRKALMEKALALINELTAKNDAVSEECCQLLTKVRKLTEENERLRAELAHRPPKLVITKVNKEDTDAHPMEQTK